MLFIADKTMTTARVCTFLALILHFRIFTQSDLFKAKTSLSNICNSFYFISYILFRRELLQYTMSVFPSGTLLTTTTSFVCPSFAIFCYMYNSKYYKHVLMYEELAFLPPILSERKWMSSMEA